MTTALPSTFPSELQPLATEVRTFFHELPRLLNEGCEGKYVVIKGDIVHGVWDTFQDARQHGYLRFDQEPFLSQKVDSRFLKLLAPHLGPASLGQVDEVA